MKRKITREIFVEIETVRVTKKRSAQKKTGEQTMADVAVEICNYANSFSRTGEQLALSTNFFKENLK
ncbi:MAG TPA: hypothetical protein VNB22_20860 [Pyrinomonadaceae bacterium]|jgi:hypothetical protein|nr:hypothetical protein [Pyrinomonadaceae bacterium]